MPVASSFIHLIGFEPEVAASRRSAKRLHLDHQGWADEIRGTPWISAAVTGDAACPALKLHDPCDRGIFDRPVAADFHQDKWCA